MAGVLRRLAIVCAALIIIGMPCWFAGAGIRAYFTPDDMMNLYGYWSKPWKEVLVANLAWYSPQYRPAGGLFYRALFAVFGPNPLPFRIACFLLVFGNLLLAYFLATSLAASREIGALTALIACYHAGFEDLYYNTGTVYDLLAFSFYVTALLVYVRRRQGGEALGSGRTILIAALYICALNSKEIAVTLPVAILLYECIYFPPRRTMGEVRSWLWRRLAVAWLLTIITVPFLYGKLSAASVFATVGDYRLHVSLKQYLATYGNYLDKMFYADVGRFTPALILLLWGAMLLLAVLSRARVLLFCLLFVLLSVLPVAFIVPRGTIFVLYIPFLGWSLFGAAAVVWLRNRISAGAAAQVATFALIASLLFVAHLFVAHRGRRHIPELDTTLASTARQMKAALPALAPKSRLLFLDDPFATDEWTPLFLVRLLYRDAWMVVDRVKTMPNPPTPAEIGSYDVVFSYQDGKLIVRPAPK